MSSITASAAVTFSGFRIVRFGPGDPLLVRLVERIEPGFVARPVDARILELNNRLPALRDGTQAVVGTMENLVKVADDTSAIAASAREIAGAVASASGRLGSTVERFLSEVAAA